MEIFAHTLGVFATNAYLLIPSRSDGALLVDAPPDALAAIAPELKEHKRKLTAVLLTHGHWDHMAGAAECRAAGAKIYAHPTDRALLESPRVQSRFLRLDIETPPVAIDEELAHGQTLELEGLRFEVRHVPGHAPGNVLFYSAKGKCAFVGDAIFAGSVGRTDLPGGDAEQLAESIRTQIYTLPLETFLLPGHGPATTVARERAGNPFVRG